jgi:hypothetical protein
VLSLPHPTEGPGNGDPYACNLVIGEVAQLIGRGAEFTPTHDLGRHLANPPLIICQRAYQRWFRRVVPRVQQCTRCPCPHPIGVTRRLPTR